MTKGYQSGARRVRAVLMLLLAGAFGGQYPSALAAENSAGAVETAKRLVTFSIKPQSLSSAIAAFADQSGVVFAYDAQLTRGMMSAGLNGRMSIEEGLGRLLGGTGLAFRFMGPGTLAIERAADQSARVLGPVRVEGAQSGATAGSNGSTDATATEGTGSYTSAALSVSSKMPQSMQATAQSVSVVTQQRMRDQNITDFTSLMNQATGVSTITSGNALNPTFYSRGFAIRNLQVDGGAPMNLVGQVGQLAPQLDMAIYDHAELLRGADGLFDGYGQPGGVISLVRKRPLDHSQVLFDSQYGSWNNSRASVDATSPLGFEGKLRGRAVLGYQDQDYFYDGADSKKTVAYGVLEYDVTSDTTARVGVDTTQLHASPFAGGLPRYSNGDDLRLPRSTCLCLSWNRSDIDTTEIFAQLDRRMGGDWALKVNLARTSQQQSSKYASFGGGVNPITLKGGTTASATSADYPSRQTGADLNLNGSFELLGHRQTLVIGANYAEVDGGGRKDYKSVSLANAAGSIFAFDPSSPAYAEPATLLSRQYLEADTKQWGAYGTLRLTFWDPLHLNLGVRFSRIDVGGMSQTYCTNAAGCPATPSGTVSVGAVTSTAPLQSYHNHDFSWPPTMTLVYDITDTLSAYGSYTDIYQDQSTYVDRAGNPIDPVTGSNVEGGIKWAPRNGKVNAALSVYRLKQEHFVGQQPDDAYLLPDGIHRCCYDNSSNQENFSQGVDLEVTGEVHPGWQLSTGYTLNKNEFKGSDSMSLAGQPLETHLPRHLLKVWSSYQFQQGEWLHRLSVGGGMNMQSKGYYVGGICLGYNDAGTCTGGMANYAITQGFWAVFSARVGYQIDGRWSAALNLNNLADRTYYQTVYSAGGLNWYGEPRNYMLTLRGSF